jgi:hypothetical protein
MRRVLPLVVAMLLPIALEGAPKQVTVTINSEPDSASVYAVMSDSAGQLRLVGYAPGRTAL